MVDMTASGLDRVFRALASEPRREMLRRAAQQPCTVTQLAEHFDMTLAAVSKHIRVLENANLLSPTYEGRVHWCRLNPEALGPAGSSIEALRGFWNERFDALEQFLVADRPPAARHTSRQKTGRR
jgi:DNA-binding transcriptional ArsR family regulator